SPRAYSLTMAESLFSTAFPRVVTGARGSRDDPAVPRCAGGAAPVRTRESDKIRRARFIVTILLLGRWRRPPYHGRALKSSARPPAGGRGRRVVRARSPRCGERAARPGARPPRRRPSTPAGSSGERDRDAHGSGRRPYRWGGSSGAIHPALRAGDIPPPGRGRGPGWSLRPRRGVRPALPRSDPGERSGTRATVKAVQR